MLVEEVRISRSIMQRNYSHCPLKKRPVPLSAREERPMQTISPYHDMDNNTEPENLSTKPEDLSRTGNYPSKASSPAVGAAPVHRRWQEPSRTPPILSPYSHHYPIHHQQITTHLPMQPMQPLIPAPLSPYLPTYMPTHLAPYPTKPTPLEPLNLNTHVEQYCSWQRPTTPYGAYVGYPHPDVYSGLSPRAACSPPVRSPLIISPASPSVCSIASPPTSPPVTRSEDIISPGSVSSDSGISAGSVPRRRRDASAPRYQCPDCGKSYSTYSGLSKHRQFHCAAAEGNLAKKSFSCKYCSKVYTSLGALKMHIRTHTLPCKCHLCGKAFSRPWLLQGHIRTHTGEKPFSCHHCRRAFADRSNLRAHLQTHSEVKKYSCASCSKTFSRMSLLSKHLEGGCPGYGPASSPYEYHPEELAAY